MERPITVFHCQKVIWEKKGEVRRDSGKLRGEVLTSSQFQSCLILETRVLEIDLKQIKITGLEGEKKSQAAVY